MSHVEHLFLCVCHLDVFFGKMLIQALCPFKKKIFLMFIFHRERERERERQSMSGGGEEREGDTESKAGSRLRAVSTEPEAGLELPDREIVTWLKSDA